MIDRQLFAFLLVLSKQPLICSHLETLKKNFSEQVDKISNHDKHLVQNKY